jgi:hypothetical protein
VQWFTTKREGRSIAMKRRAVLLAVVCVMLLASSSVYAGRNAGGAANLTWVLNNHVRYSDMPSGVKDLYLRLEGISEVVGVEYGMSWSPSATLGCFELIDVQAPVSTDCTFLMRGTVVFGLKDIQTYRVDAAFAASNWVIACTGGQVAKMPFDFSTCSPTLGGVMNLDYCKVTDHFGQIDDMEVIPCWSSAYVNCPTGVEPATWGSIKALYQ